MATLLIRDLYLIESPSNERNNATMADFRHSLFLFLDWGISFATLYYIA